MVALLRKVVVLSPVPVLTETIEGGAQRVLADVVRALRSMSDSCLVAHSDLWKTSRSFGAHFDETLSPRPRVEVEEFRGQHVTRREIDLASLSKPIRTADLVLIADRSIGLLPTGPRYVLCLSNLAYDNEKAAIECREWDSIWVMSEYLRDQVVREHCYEKRSVRVISPMLDERYLSGIASDMADDWLSALTGVQRSDTSRWRVLAFPHRPDPGKGLLEAIRLLRRLTYKDARWRLIVTEPSKFESLDNKMFFINAVDECARIGILGNLVTVPWLRPIDVRNLYSIADCTLMASSLPEGFGLVPLESIACGTPVVARATGALPLLADRINSLFLVNEIDSVECADTVIEAAGSRVSYKDRQYLIQTYSYRNHLNLVRKAVIDLLVRGGDEIERRRE